MLVLMVIILRYTYRIAQKVLAKINKQIPDIGIGRSQRKGAPGGALSSDTATLSLRNLCHRTGVGVVGVGVGDRRVVVGRRGRPPVSSVSSAIADGNAG